MATNECPQLNVLARTECILTYDHNVWHVAINYSLVLLSVLATRQRSGFIFVGLISFQVGLCLWLMCAGVSIVWCAIAGWMLCERRQAVEERWRDIVLVLDGSAILYYALVAPLLTTVAHACAVLLGIFLFGVHQHLVGSRTTTNVSYGIRSDLNEEVYQGHG